MKLSFFQKEWTAVIAGNKLDNTTDANYCRGKFLDGSAEIGNTP